MQNKKIIIIRVGEADAERRGRGRRGQVGGGIIIQKTRKKTKGGSRCWREDV